MTPLARRIALGIAAAVTLGFLLAALVPSARAQLVMTLTRQPASFVELAFAEPETARACDVKRGELLVHLQLTAHGQRAGALDVSVAVVSADTADEQQLIRHLLVKSGDRIEFVESLPVPQSGQFSVLAQVVDGHELVRLRCDLS